MECMGKRTGKRTRTEHIFFLPSNHIQYWVFLQRTLQANQSCGWAVDVMMCVSSPFAPFIASVEFGFCAQKTESR
jgi:hypothetical protein